MAESSIHRGRAVTRRGRGAVSRRAAVALLAATALLAVGAAKAPVAHATAIPPPTDDKGSISISGGVILPHFPSGTGWLGPVTASFCADGTVVDSSGVRHTYSDGGNISTTVGVTLCSGGGSGSLTATFDYDEPCPPAAGFAAGQLNLAGDSDIEYFFWVRSGTNAVIQINDSPAADATTQSVGWETTVDGAAAATFAPVPGPGNVCNPVTGPLQGGPIPAAVVGSGSWT